MTRSASDRSRSTSPQVNAYHVILEVPPAMAGRSDTLDKLYVKSSTGQPVPLSSLVHWTPMPVQPLSINHQSQFPAVTISFNLARRRGAGRRGERDPGDRCGRWACR